MQTVYGKLNYIIKETPELEILRNKVKELEAQISELKENQADSE